MTTTVRIAQQRLYDFFNDTDRKELIQLKGDLYLRRACTIRDGEVIYDPPTEQEAELERDIDKTLAMIKAEYFDDRESQ
jgi:hypothetical protein